MCANAKRSSNVFLPICYCLLSWLLSVDNSADLNVAEGSEAHLSGHAPTGSQQRRPRSLQSCQTDREQT